MLSKFELYKITSRVLSVRSLGCFLVFSLIQSNAQRTYEYFSVLRKAFYNIVLGLLYSDIYINVKDNYVLLSTLIEIYCIDLKEHVII